MNRSLFAIGVFATLTFGETTRPELRGTRTPLCTMATGDARLVMRAERDTLMPFVNAPVQVTSASSVRNRPGDPPADSQPLMRTARVKVLLLDKASRAILFAAGIRDSQPMAYLQAFTYGADCRPVAWRDTQPFVELGERGYVVAMLTPPPTWIDGLPVFVVTHPRAYPYPLRRDVLASLLPRPNNPASPEEVFDFETSVNQRDSTFAGSSFDDTVRSARAITWAHAHADAREREPIRTDLRNLLMRSDMTRIDQMRSRLRGTYRVSMQTGDTTLAWWFRTVDKPAYLWRENDERLSTEQMLKAPFASYTLVGYAVHDSATLALADLAESSTAHARLVWLSVDDRPSLPGNASRLALTAKLEFRLKVAQEALWPALEVYNKALSKEDSLFFVRIKRPLAREDRQPMLPMTLQITREGALKADTALVRDGRTLRVTVTRTDTIAVVRLW